MQSRPAPPVVRTGQRALLRRYHPPSLKMQDGLDPPRKSDSDPTKNPRATRNDREPSGTNRNDNALVRDGVKREPQVRNVRWFSSPPFASRAACALRRAWGFGLHPPGPFQPRTHYFPGTSNLRHPEVAAPRRERKPRGANRRPLERRRRPEGFGASPPSPFASGQPVTVSQ